MNTDEQTLIDGLFSRLKQAETDGAERDVQAYERIKEHAARQPAAPYYMAQAILVQEAAIKRLDEQNRQLKADLAKVQAQGPSQPQSSGGFLSSIFGGGARESRPVAPTGSGGWRDPAPSYGAQPAPVAPQNYAPPVGQPGGGFMRGALQTAAGVAGGMMLAEGLSSLFHGGNEHEIVEIIKEEPSPASDNASDTGGDWNNADEQRLTSNDDFSNDQGGFVDTDYGDDSGSFSDDEFV